jgi:hypothetical protein
MFNSGRTFHSYSQLSWTHSSLELVVPELSHSDIASYWHIVSYHLTWYSQACVMACQPVISGTFKHMSRAKAREPGENPYGSSNSGLHGMHCSGQWIMSLAWVILHGGLVLVCTSVLSTLCSVSRLACTSILSTLCIVWYCHALVFLAHDVLFEISLTNFEAFINTSQWIEFNLSTINFDLTWL